MSQRYEPGVRRLEPAGVEVEPPKVILEVDMKPLAPSSPRFGYYYGDEPPPDPSSCCPRANHGVYNEGMYSTVPSDIDKPDQSGGGGVSTHPTETMHPNSALPVLIKKLMVERFRVQGVHRRIVELTSPLEPVHAAFRHRTLSATRTGALFLRPPECSEGASRSAEVLLEAPLFLRRH